MKKILNLNYDSRYPDICNLDIYLPDTNELCPVFIYFHGGGLEGGNKNVSESLEKIVMQNIALVSVDYRMYPNAKFPDFIEDAAKAIDYIIKYDKEHKLFSSYFVGGSSAGAYLSMMLYFDHRYLNQYEIDVSSIKGWFFNAGQPTVHYRVLKERGFDTRLIRVDEAAPIYFINKDIDSTNQANLMFVIAEHDMVGRLEQTNLLLNVMKQFKFDTNKVSYKYMRGCNHCSYPIDDLVTELIKESIK